MRAIATSLFAVANVMASLSAAQGDRRTPTVIIGGAVGQTVLLLAFADDPTRMVWLQVLAMGLLLVITAWGESAGHRCAYQQRPVAVS